MDDERIAVLKEMVDDEAKIERIFRGIDDYIVVLKSHAHVTQMRPKLPVAIASRGVIVTAAGEAGKCDVCMRWFSSDACDLLEGARAPRA
jgi:predicted PhzF superfamily epimerase YddE/YHI9